MGVWQTGSSCQAFGNVHSLLGEIFGVYLKESAFKLLPDYISHILPSEYPSGCVAFCKILKWNSRYYIKIYFFYFTLFFALIFINCKKKIEIWISQWYHQTCGLWILMSKKNVVKILSLFLVFSIPLIFRAVKCLFYLTSLKYIIGINFA